MNKDQAFALGRNLDIEDIPFSATKWDVKEAFATVLHGPRFYDPNAHQARPINFMVQLHESRNSLPNNGHGTILIPDRKKADDLLWWSRGTHNGVYVLGRKVYLKRSERPPGTRLVMSLLRTPFVDPRIESEREEKLARLSEARVLLDAVQFGIFRSPSSNDPHTTKRRFSKEFEIREDQTYAGEMFLDYDRKLFRIEMGDCVSEEMATHIVIDEPNIKKSSHGYDKKTGEYYACLQLWCPARFERQLRYRAYCGDRRKDRMNFRERLPHLGGLHEDTTQYAYHLRLIFYDHLSIKDFIWLCEQANFRPPAAEQIRVETGGFFHPQTMSDARQWIHTFEWPVRIQLEALLYNGLAHTRDIYELRKDIQDLASERPALAGDFLRRLSEKLRIKDDKQTVEECFRTTLKAEMQYADKLALGLETEAESYRPRGSLECLHAIVTPTRVLIEGPISTQSNRVVRKYYEYREHFIRVEFREETRMSFRWPREVNGASLIKARFGHILKNGVEIAGRLFRFLGYSGSGLREHSIWFMSDFHHPVEGLITPEKIRNDLGNFDKCKHIPSKYAARIALAFSGTDPSVPITRDRWEIVPDLGEEPYQHTDGQGTISVELRDKIWEALVRDRPHFGGLILKPSAFLIRFFGFKGMVAVDERLQGVRMRLRESMHKFQAKDDSTGEIEIAKAFLKPGPARMCRPLIAVLEDRGVRRAAFLDLQDKAKKKVLTSWDSLQQVIELLREHDLGNVYGLRWLLERLHHHGMVTELEDERKQQSAHVLKNEFMIRLVQFAQTYILRDIKYDARIPIENAHQLVGIVDEGPAWVNEGVQDVFCLQEGQIFACVQKPETNEPIWIEGQVTISRSPHIHPGDVQLVWAIGKPPDDVPCFFRNVRNVVVMPSVGVRSLASCLAGGDVDGDEFLIIKDETLLPDEHADPADYPPVKPKSIERDSTIDDVCDFVVEYMQSDVVGALASQHLIIADQSKYGTFDRDCMTLSALCSQAVDYPKNGNPVSMENMPEPLIRAKPDWKTPEDAEVREGDFYESTRALGALFRDIEIKSVELPPSSFPENGPLTPIKEPPLSDSISLALRPSLERHLGRFYNSESDLADIEPLFRYYARELSYICLTHAPAEHSDVRLSEEEVTVGVILAKCTQRHWKKDRVYRMREHASQLVRDVKTRQRGLGSPAWRNKASQNVGPEERAKERAEVLAALPRAWSAWDFGMRYRSAFGARSFGLIGLGVVCDMLNRLEKLDLASTTR